MSEHRSRAAELRVEFCGEWTVLAPPGPFSIGREGDLSIDDNPYLHRHFLELRWDRLWWLVNVGARLTATVSDGDGAMHAWLSPGASLPLVFGVTEVRFTAGATNYLLGLHVAAAPAQASSLRSAEGGATTLHVASLSANQRRCLLAIAEPALCNTGTGSSSVPSSATAAARLGWTITRFNRQLDTVCQKLSTAGVQGLHGGTDRLATNRRARLVEYALATRMVTPDDLALLDAPDTGTAIVTDPDDEQR